MFTIPLLMINPLFGNTRALVTFIFAPHVVFAIMGEVRTLPSSYDVLSFQ